jgi:hypothetical protein
VPTPEPTTVPTPEPTTVPTPEPTQQPQPTPQPQPQPVPVPTPDPSTAPAPSPLGALVGTWSLQPLTEGGVTYLNTAMEISPDGTGRLVSHDEDACNWKDGDPVWRGLQGAGTSFVGERYIGPCVPPPGDWLPATISLSEDGRTLQETVDSTGQTRTWIKR